jgi:predicted enzyme related to lactoylglutathione lyase
MPEAAVSNPVGWFEIYVDDIERAKTFYQAVFGIELSKLENTVQPPGMQMWAFPMHQDARGVTGALVKVPGVAAGGNSVLVYFMCADCADEAAKAEQASGQIAKPKMSIGQYGYIALVTDTEGNTIGLHSMQ